ncbi:MAG: methyltransferase domain-containing protein [bacterium]|nr:methyltransferase domain-containing protein [bacterium]
MESEKLLKQKIIFHLGQFSRITAFDEIKETAIPSYIHKNPIVRQIFWQRVFIILNQIKKLSPKSMLDFGCGSGIITALIDPEVDRFVTDISFEPFDFMQQRIDYLRNVTKLYPNDLDKTESRFEMILAADVLEHLEGDRIKNQLALFHKWLKHDGHLVISGPTENLIYKIGRKIAGYKNDYHKTNIKVIADTVSKSALFKLNAKIRYPVPFICEGFWILTYDKV